MERTKVVECARQVLDYMGMSPELAFDPSKPTGPYNRVCDLSLCREVLDWEPQTSFRDGLHATIDWYLGTHDADAIRGNLERMLTERIHA